MKHSTDGASLVEVIDRILDKGIVVDLWARVNLVGIELLSIEARIVIASVRTWLCYANAVGLLKHEHDHGQEVYAMAQLLQNNALAVII